MRRLGGCEAVEENHSAEDKMRIHPKDARQERE
jgi:hypothetical protein